MRDVMQLCDTVRETSFAILRRLGGTRPHRAQLFLQSVVQIE